MNGRGKRPEISGNSVLQQRLFYYALAMSSDADVLLTPIPRPPTFLTPLPLPPPPSYSYIPFSFPYLKDLSRHPWMRHVLRQVVVVHVVQTMGLRVGKKRVVSRLQSGQIESGSSLLREALARKDKEVEEIRRKKDVG